MSIFKIKELSILMTIS